MPALVKAPIRDLQFCADGYYFAFQTDFNPASHGTFDPTVFYSGSGTPLWLFQNGQVLTGAAISTTGTAQGLNGTVQTVTLVVQQPEQVTGFDMNNDRIFGTFNIPSVFSSLNFIRLDSNPTLSAINAKPNAAPITTFWVQSCGITGNLNLYNLSNLGGSLQFQSNSGLTGITFPPASPTAYTLIRGNNCNLSSINVSNVVTNTSTQIILNANASLSTFTRAANMTLNILLLNSCNFSTFSFAGMTFGGTLPAFQINNQAANVLTSVSGAASGTMNIFRVDSNASLAGSLDISGLNWVGNGILQLFNTQITNVIHGSSTGTIRIYVFGQQNVVNQYWSLGSITISNSNLVFQFNQAGAMPVATVNQWLIDLDAKLGSGTGAIECSGGQPPPTGAGITAKNSLIAKGYTVTTS